MVNPGVELDYRADGDYADIDGTMAVMMAMLMEMTIQMTVTVQMKNQ